jgi:xanthine/CO dehydrogenase XdhC/CoxF family maturation factor
MMLSDWIVMTPCFLAASVAAEITKAFLRQRANRPAVPQAVH